MQNVVILPSRKKLFTAGLSFDIITLSEGDTKDAGITGKQKAIVYRRGKREP